MSEIIPRWEWRTFGRDFESAEAIFASMTPVGSNESHELYLLVPGGANVKVRDGLMDIKVLEEVDADGLERWMPILKAPFPLSGSEATAVLDALGLDTSRIDRDAYSLDQVLDELVGRGAGVDVRKRRTRYALGGCMTELTDVAVNGRPTRTVAVESEDKAAVLATFHELGFDGYLNINYSDGLKRVIDDTPARYAVIDVGTNSVKFHVGERTNDDSWEVPVDRADVTRLGEGLDEHGVIAPAALERTAAAIETMVDEARRMDVLAIAAVGTAGMRIAQNRDEVVDVIQTRTGISLEVISGEEESRLAYLAVQAGLGLDDGPLVVFDTGGGSSQFTFGTGSLVDERFSVDVGAVRYTEQFGLDGVVSPEVLRRATAAISVHLSSIAERPVPDSLVGMGGAITNMTGVSLEMAKYDPDIVQGAILHRDEIDRQIEMYRSLGVVDRRAIVGLQPKRAGVILAGACIVRTVMDALNQKTLIVSDRGLRHGVFIERFGDLPPT